MAIIERNRGDKMKEAAKDKNFDHTLKLLKEGYYFIINRREALNTNIFQTKLIGKKMYCLSGRKQAELFYDNELFKRQGAAPSRVNKTLFGEGGVQGLDEGAHYKRKGMFMELMGNQEMVEISKLIYKYWLAYFDHISNRKNVNMYEASKKVFLQTACEWTGVPLKENESDKRASQLSNLFENAASVGLKHWKSRRERIKAEKWIEELVHDIRNGNFNLDKDKALYKFSWFHDIDGKLLGEKVVAVEILNLLRPMTAVSVWVANIGLAMYQFPEEAKKLQNGEEKKIMMFLQETRRYYPFFPFTVAKVKKDFEYNGFKFKKGTITLLDLYGTNKHPEDWSNPQQFIPERFEHWEQTPFNFIPQGGGSYDFGHRCAGEFVTMAMLKATMDFLIKHITYDIPEQSFDFNFNDIPAVPNDGFIINNVRFI